MVQDLKERRSFLRDLALPVLVEYLWTAYPHLRQFSQEKLTSLASELSEARREQRTTYYIIITVSAVMMLGTFPFFLGFGFRWAWSVEPMLELAFQQRSFLDTHPEMAFALGAAGFGSFFYTLLMHQTWMSGWFQKALKSLRSGSFAKFGDINRTSGQYIFYAAFLNYVVLGVMLLYLCSYTTPGNQPTKWGIVIWLCLPLPLLSLIPTFVLIFVLAIFFHREKQFRRAPQAVILQELLLLLDLLTNVFTPSQLSSRLRKQIMKSISKISDMLRNLYDPEKLRDASGLWASRKMNLVADNFLVLSTWVAFPKEDTVKQLKDRIELYATIMASGTYDALPREIVGEDSGLLRETRRASQWRNIMNLGALFLLVLAPLGVFVLCVSYFGVDLPSGLRPTAAIAYSAWVVLCLLTHLDKLAPEARTTMIDIIRLVFPTKS